MYKIFFIVRFFTRSINLFYTCSKRLPIFFFILRKWIFYLRIIRVGWMKIFSGPYSTRYFTLCLLVNRHSHKDSKKTCNIGKLQKRFFSIRFAQISNFFIVALILCRIHIYLIICPWE